MSTDEGQPDKGEYPPVLLDDGRVLVHRPLPTGDPESDRQNAISALARVMQDDERWDRQPTWSDCWNAARIAYEQGWRAGDSESYRAAGEGL